MKYRILVATLCVIILFSSSIHAQLLTEVVSRFNSLSNLTYKMSLKQKDIFSDQIFNDTINANFILSGNKDLFKITGTKIQEIYDGNKLIKMDLSTLTYRIANSIENSIFIYQSLPHIVTSLKEDIRKNAPIKQLNDSLVNGKKYYHLEITEIDTVEKDKRVFRIIKVLIDKKNYFPIYYKSEQQGFVDGTDMFVDTYSEIHFFDYQLNNKNLHNFLDLEIPANFVMKKSEIPKLLLVEGTKAPELDLKDRFGNAFELKSQRGKIVLINFTLNGCPHCIESINMLNTLYLKYGKQNFSIVTINPFDNKESTEKYNVKFNVKYPFFISTSNETHNVDKYNIDGYPTFYLIDKNGDIIKGFSGYYKSLDEELNNLIKSHL